MQYSPLNMRFFNIRMNKNVLTNRLRCGILLSNKATATNRAYRKDASP